MTKGLPLKFNYPMMSLIRELVIAERHRVWKQKYSHRMQKNATLEDNQEAYRKIIEECRSPLLRQGLCNLILDQCNEVEDLIKASLKGKQFFCEECNEETWVLGSEKNVNKDFVFLPRWRELACGHIVGIQGKPLIGEKLEKVKKELCEWRKRV